MGMILFYWASLFFFMMLRQQYYPSLHVFFCLVNCRWRFQYCATYELLFIIIDLVRI